MSVLLTPLEEPFAHLAPPLPNLLHPPLPLPRQRHAPPLRDNQRMLKLRSPPSILCSGRPIVLPSDVLVSTLAYHRFNRENVTDLHNPRRLLIPIMQDIRSRMKRLTNPVPAERLYGRVT